MFILSGKNINSDLFVLILTCSTDLLLPLLKLRSSIKLQTYDQKSEHINFVYPRNNSQGLFTFFFKQILLPPSDLSNLDFVLPYVQPTCIYAGECLMSNNQMLLLHCITFISLLPFLSKAKAYFDP